MIGGARSFGAGVKRWWFIVASATFIIALAVGQVAQGRRHAARQAALQASFAAIPTVALRTAITGVTAGGLVVDLKRVGYTCRTHTGEDGYICTDGESEVVVLRGGDGWIKSVSCSIESEGTYPWNRARAKCDPIVGLVLATDEFLTADINDDMVGWKGQSITVRDEAVTFEAGHTDNRYWYRLIPGTVDD